MPLLIILLLFLSFPAVSGGTAEEGPYIVIQEIVIEGNKRTRDKIIRRELDISVGDTIQAQHIHQHFLTNKNRVFNTGLFLEVEVYMRGKSPIEKALVVEVKERWYTYPIPILELADRNFNEWWEVRDRDIRRTNLGIDFRQKNMRGMNETLKIKLQGGFDNKAEMFYVIPYLDSAQQFGLNMYVSYITNKQIAYRTTNHMLAFHEDERFIKHRFSTGFMFTYRRKFYETHQLGLSFYHSSVGDTVAVLNPDYFLDGRTSQTMLALKYAWINDRRDIVYYPLKGHLMMAEAEKLGLGLFNDINQLDLRGEFSLYRPLGKNWFWAGTIRQKLSFPGRQPYFNIRGLGYLTDVVSGYELYVIDGQHYSLGKINLKKRIFYTEKKVNAMPNQKFKSIPIGLYLKAHADAGYVHHPFPEPDNLRLTNTLLYGAGMGLDFVTYYDIVVRLEYSLNRMMESGFFVHFKASI
ncbi:BamA/TamA family outer membrane protein [Cytophagaceae bacterium ABcell3]|nr:BamA/TamA family outer membrane protein [Cytophagaceae bacterium ABcell3]